MKEVLELLQQAELKLAEVRKRADTTDLRDMQGDIHHFIIKHTT